MSMSKSFLKLFKKTKKKTVTRSRSAQLLSDRKALLSSKSQKLRSWTEQSSLMIGLNAADADVQLDKNNWVPAFTAVLDRFKSEGFERVNPSIIKETILSDYPGFEEKKIGFKRFSDVMKALEKEGLLIVEMDEAHNMLLKIC